MKVKCRGYIGWLKTIEVMSETITEVSINYRVYMKVNRDFIDLRNVKLEEIEFIREED